jgi:hypothetical protein
MHLKLIVVIIEVHHCKIETVTMHSNRKVVATE